MLTTDRPTPPREATSLPTASLADTATVLARVLAPTLAKGPIIRRPTMVGLAERFSLDDRAVRVVERLHDRYAPGPLRLPIPGMSLLLVLEARHVHRILEAAPDPFSPASTLKVAALRHFQPHNVLITKDPSTRQERRSYHEEILEFGNPLHSLADRFTGVIWEEAIALLAEARRLGRLRWKEFSTTWFRVVRRVVFGDGAADDVELTRMVDRLRADGNWAFFKGRKDALRERFLGRIGEYLRHAEEGSLAHVMQGVHANERTEPEHQVPQWLFAFDPAGMTTFRTLALLATHLDAEERARDEVVEARHDARHERPFLRACVLESLRLWPTTPMVLRRVVRDVDWDEGRLHEGDEVLIYAPCFHRDRRRLPFADRFSPELFLRERTQEDWPLIPFSSGPAGCPGQDLVLHTTTTMLSALLDELRWRVAGPQRLDPRAPLPGSLDNYRLEFELVA
jgi:cytochrome P450